MTVYVYLSRRNLLALLSKLDRRAQGEMSACTIIKRDHKHPVFPQSDPVIHVTAVEDEHYYTERAPGYVVPADDPDLKGPR
jgi:hypothetical protein